MAKIVRLTEGDLEKIIKKVVNEQKNTSMVIALQNALKNFKYGKYLGTSGPNRDGVDGSFGEKTKRALIKFQSDNNIYPADGRITTNTLIKLGVLSSSKKDKVGLDTDRRNSNTPTSVSKDTLISKSVNPNFLQTIDSSKLSTNNSVKIMKAGQPECSRFVNEFSEKVGPLGNAWIAHNNSNAGELVWSAFNNLGEDKIKIATEIFNRIQKTGKPEPGGPQNKTVSKLVNSIVPKTVPIGLQVDDVVGIYYPDSSHHEEAFHQAATEGGSFVKDSSGAFVPSQKTVSGQGWGMNTHLGIVGAIKNGVPIIFHNIKGQVFADPANNLVDNGRIAWVRRPQGGFMGWVQNMELNKIAKNLKKTLFGS